MRNLTELPRVVVQEIKQIGMFEQTWYQVVVYLLAACIQGMDSKSNCRTPPLPSIVEQNGHKFTFQNTLTMLLNANSCPQHTARPNEQKHWSLEQRKIYFRAVQGEWVAHAPKSPNSWKGFSKPLLKVR